MLCWLCIPSSHRQPVPSIKLARLLYCQALTPVAALKDQRTAWPYRCLMRRQAPAFTILNVPEGHD